MALDVTKVPDCDNCFLKDSCADAVPGQFCTAWISRDPPKREPDPNEQWRKGEDVAF